MRRRVRFVGQALDVMNVDPELLFKSHSGHADLFDRLQNCVEQHVIKTSGGSLPVTPFRHQMTIFQRSETALVWMMLEAKTVSCFAIELVLDNRRINPLVLLAEDSNFRRVPARTH